MAPEASRHALAADIGGTAMRAALVDRDGAVLARADCATEAERGLDDAAARLAVLLAEVRAAAPAGVVGAGVSTAGPVDPTSGAYRHPPNLPGWHGHTMKPALERALRLPVSVGHDATLAAAAEMRFGAAAGATDFLYVTVSTGIGAGIVANGEAVTGASGGAGEVGHMIVRPGGPACGAGCAGCLEGTASGSAIAAEAARRVAAGDRTRLGELAAAREGISARDVFEAADGGDAVAAEIVDAAIGALGTGLAGLLAIFDPEVVVLGGGLLPGLRARWDGLLAAVQEHALPRYADGVPLVPTALGDSAGLLGAAVAAFDRADRERAPAR